MQSTFPKMRWTWPGAISTRMNCRTESTLIESDLYSNVPDKKYDLIITNPPYVNSGSMAKLPKEYMHEPQIALAGGEDGMDLVRKIVAGAAQRLTEDGLLMVEIGNERAFAEAAFPELNLTWLSTSAGDDMVFLVEAGQLADFTA